MQAQSVNKEDLYDDDGLNNLKSFRSQSLYHGVADKIAELTAEVIEDEEKILRLNNNVTKGLCWHVIFSPDESFFAWICGSRKIVLVPWNSNKNTIVGEKDSWIKIFCGYPILSAAFGIGPSPPTPKVSWTRCKFEKLSILATGHGNGRIRIWSVHSGVLLLELTDHGAGVRDLSFAPDNSLRLISASLDKTLKGWDLNDDGNMFKTFFAHKGSVLWCTWSPNAKLLASAGSDKTVYLWDMKRYELFGQLNGHYNEVVSCVFSPDGAILATASWDSQVILWDPYKMKKLRCLSHIHPPPNLIWASGANSAWVRGVSYSPNGINIVTISDDHLIRFWNLLGDVDPEGIRTEEEETLSCTYSPSGRVVAVATNQFKVSFYTTPSEISTLKHLARMTLRSKITSLDVDLMSLPISLKSYLNYESWK